MYSISTEALDLFKKSYRQVARITYRRSGNTMILTEADILQGGLTIDRYVISGTKIEIGSAIAAELKLRLDNRDDKFSDVTFEDAELEVEIGIKKWDAYKWENAQMHWIPFGFFTVDDPPRKLSSINLVALDRMVKFDCPIVDGLFPATVQNLIRFCCADCNVELATDPSTLTNCDYLITFSPDEDEELTYRQLIQWLAEITGTCAYIDRTGKLRFEWYHGTSTVIRGSDRYTGSDMYENDIAITGVQVTDSDENIYLVGTDDYAFNVVGNELVSHDHGTIATALKNKLYGFTYRPYSCNVRPMPHLDPLDCITYVDKNEISHSSIISHFTFKINSATSVAGKGETVKKNSYSAGNPLNKHESIVIQKMRKRMREGDAFVEQLFRAADGVLESRISAEILRAENSESSLSTQILQNAESISLKASQVDVDALTGRVSEAESSLSLESDKIALLVTSSNTIKAASIVAAINSAGSTVKISADHININGIVTIGNLATMSDIPTRTSDLTNNSGFITSASVPTKLSQLTNDSGYKTQSGVVTIINGTVDADFVNALGISAAALLIRDSSNRILLSAGGTNVKIAGWNIDYNSFFSGNTFNNSTVFLCTGSVGNMTIGGHSGSNWVFKAGSNFGVNTNGEMYCTSGYFTGTIDATSGYIGDWIISDGQIRSREGVFGSYSYTTTGTNLIVVEGYMFTVLTSSGIRYYIKGASSFSNETLAILVPVNNWRGINTGGGVVI